MKENSNIPELIAMSACEVQALLASKQISSRELLDAVEQRITDVDGVINALPTLCFERARKQTLSSNFRETTLGGIPVAIKDLDNVAGVRTTNGSKLFENFVPKESCILVDHLESNGAIVYAKSNTPEFGTGGNTVNYFRLAVKAYT